MLLQDVGTFLVVPDDELLLPLHASHFIGHAQYLLIHFLYSKLQFLVSVPLKDQIVLHGLVDAIEVVLLVQLVIAIRRLLHPVSQLALQVPLLTSDAFQLLVDKV